MKYRLKQMGLLSLFCIFLLIDASAQEVYNSSGRRINSATKKKQQKTGFDPQRLVVGGGLGLAFGDITSISASPVVGYRFTDKFLAGVGLGFQYYREKDAFQVYNAVSGGYDYYPLKATFLYPSVWARYLVFENVFAHVEAEYDMQTVKFYDPASTPNGDPITSKQHWNSPAVLVGAGLRQPITDRSSLVLIALYDVIQHEYSPYRNQINFRIGFNVGF